MDASATTITTDSLGRRSGPRRRRSAAEKRQIVEETLQRGASVAVIARRHGVNANSVFGWRRLYERGQLGSARRSTQAALVPVSLTSDEEPSRTPARRKRSEDRIHRSVEGFVEVDLSGGGHFRVHGDLARELLRQLIERLLNR